MLVLNRDNLSGPNIPETPAACQVCGYRIGDLSQGLPKVIFCLFVSSGDSPSVLEMTPFRKPKPTPYRKPESSLGPQHREHLSGRRAQSRARSPPLPIPEAAAAPKIVENQEAPTPPVPAFRQYSVQLPPFFVSTEIRASYRRSANAVSVSKDPLAAAPGFHGLDFVCSSHTCVGERRAFWGARRY